MISRALLVLTGLACAAVVRGATLAVDLNGGGGGGVYCAATSTMFSNCTIAGNSAGYDGGVYCVDAFPTFINCTIAGNSSNSGGGLLGLQGSSPIVTNCIIWDNEGGAITVESDEALISVRYSCVEGSWEGEANKDADPLFVRRSA